MHAARVLVSGCSYHFAALCALLLSGRANRAAAKSNQGTSVSGSGLPVQLGVTKFMNRGPKFLNRDKFLNLSF